MFSLMSITLRTSLGQCLGSVVNAYIPAQIQAKIRIRTSSDFLCQRKREDIQPNSELPFSTLFFAYLADWLTNMASIWLWSLVRILSRSPPCSSSSLVRPSNSGRSNTNRMKDRLPGNTRLIPVHNNSSIRLIPHSNIRFTSAHNNSNIRLISAKNNSNIRLISAKNNSNIKLISA
jgi:hypothetical protein